MSLAPAAAESGWSTEVSSLIARGGYVMIPLLILSIISVMLIVERLDLLGQPQWQDQPSPTGKVESCASLGRCSIGSWRGSR